jgi:uncharacterized RDD family membrane protein YckC
MDHTVTELDDFLTAIGHPLRRQILETVYENPDITYSKILGHVNISSGKLNFHLQKLDAFLSQDDGRYRISDEGLKLFRTWQMLEGRLSGTETPREETHRIFFSRRLIAFFIDVALILALIFIAADFTALNIAPAWWLFDMPMPVFLTRMMDLLFGYPDLIVVLIRAFVLALLWMYFALMEGYRGQTLGKMLVGLRIVDISGARMQPFPAAIRALTKVLILPFDVLVGLFKSKKHGFLRFFGQYTRTWVVRGH